MGEKIKIPKYLGIELLKVKEEAKILRNELEYYYDLVPDGTRLRLFKLSNEKKISFHLGMLFLGLFFSKGCEQNFVEIYAYELDSFLKKGRYVEIVRKLIKYEFIKRKKFRSDGPYSYMLNPHDTFFDDDIPNNIEPIFNDDEFNDVEQIFPFKEQSTTNTVCNCKCKKIDNTIDNEKFELPKEMTDGDANYTEIKISVDDLFEQKKAETLKLIKEKPEVDFDIDYNIVDFLIEKIHVENYFDNTGGFIRLKINDLYFDLKKIFNIDDVTAKRMAWIIGYIKIYSDTNIHIDKVIYADNTLMNVYDASSIKYKSDYSYIGNFFKKMKYKDFLNTLYWRTISKCIREFAHNKCQVCGEKEKKLNVHHNTYEHHGFEITHTEDLVCLCEECHHLYHENNKIKEQKYFNKEKKQIEEFALASASA